MNRFSVCLIVSFLLASCVENTVESQLVEGADDSRALRSLLTKSVGSHQEDSLTMLSKLQSDVDYLMMGRVIQKDSLFVLAIKKEDALFLGVTEDVYDKYLDYVVRHNEQLSENRRN